MAESLKTFDFRTVGRPTKYNWRTWANGQPWKLVTGTDFTVPAETMRSNAFQWAKKNGMTVRTAVVDEGKAIVIQFTPTENTK
jgi:hypothetical protein